MSASEHHDGATSTTTISTTSPALITYHSDVLKRIGEYCSHRLPPASAVQAMLLYEMQRETEVEKLFHHQMFRLARAEQENEAKDKLIETLGDRLTKLELRANERERDDRLATSLVRMQSLAQNLQDCLQRLSSLDIRVTVLQNKLHDLDKQEMKMARLTHETAAKQVPQPDDLPHKADIERIDADVESLYNDNRDIWKDRQATQLLITDVQNRIAMLEAKLKILQVREKQSTSSPSTSSTAMTPYAYPQLPSNENTAMTTFNFPSFQQSMMSPFAYPMGPAQYWNA